MKKRVKISENTLGDLWDNIKRNHICNTEDSEEERKRARIIIWRNDAENLHNLGEGNRHPGPESPEKPKRNTPGHTTKNSKS